MSSTTTNYHYVYINNVFGSFVRGLADYFRTEMYPRTKETVIGTYERSVQHFLNRQKDPGEKHSVEYPFITFNPEITFEPEERMGKFFHQYPNFENRWANYICEPKLYDDGNVSIAPVINRYKGTFEIILWLGSVYETIDQRAYTYQFFGGLDRPIYPKAIDGYFIVPDELITYNYNNPYNGVNYNLDWSGTDVTQTLVKNINQNKWTWPFEIKPWIKLTGIDDGTEKYGGSGDELSDHRMTIQLEWECNLPTHLAVKIDKMPDNYSGLDFSINTGFHYVPTSSIGGITIPQDKIITTNDSTSTYSVDTTIDTTYNYIVTATNAVSILADEIFEITLLKEVVDQNLIHVYAKLGMLTPEMHWRLKDSFTIEIVGFNMDLLLEGDIITISYYKDDTPSLI